MFEFAKKLTGIDLSGAVAVPPWLFAVLAAALAVSLAFVAMRGMRRVSSIFIVIVCVIAGTAVWVLDRLAARDLAGERRALDERAFALKLQALMPGSALACVEAIAPAIQDACEKALFAGPETAAAAVAYVTAQLELLSDARKHMQASGLGYSDNIMAVRTAIERDQFGIVAHVFATRRACRPDQCDLFVLLQDNGRVRANLEERPFEAYVALHSPEWAAHSNRSGAGVAGIRNPYAAIQLLPGSDLRPDNSIRINGLPGNSQNLRIDGQDATNGFAPGSGTLMQPSVDALQARTHAATARSH